MSTVEQDVRSIEQRLPDAPHLLRLVREDLGEMRKLMSGFTVAPKADESGENRHLTMRDVYVYVGGFGTFYALGKLMGWF